MRRQDSGSQSSTEELLRTHVVPQIVECRQRSETTFYEYLLYQSPDSNCGVFYVKSGYTHFHELRLWNASAVSAYKECLQRYAYYIPQGEIITMYYNGLCPHIFLD
ncbi:uncharacterized protein [Dermacentor albipictus]|uniref:uncharacterized protein n=1 Tax=Dermacentor albipictus TaxID=60249 RepID=UPI0038FC4F81